jgi:hypothetical protein
VTETRVGGVAGALAGTIASATAASAVAIAVRIFLPPAALMNLLKSLALDHFLCRSNPALHPAATPAFRFAGNAGLAA